MITRSLIRNGHSLFKAFLIKFSATSAVVPVIPLIAVISTAGLEFLVSLAPVISKSPVVAPALISPMTPNVRGIGEFKLPLGDCCELTLNGVIMHGFLMPVGVRELHVVSD